MRVPHLTSRPLLALSCLLAVLAGVLAVTAPEATADDAPVSVTWPQTTAFNPDATPPAHDRP